MSQEKLINHLITALEQTEFDKLALLYLDEVEGLSNIIACNGPYDSGLDMRSINPSEIEVQYQATIQEKKFEGKLFSDMQKAKVNLDTYGLPKRVIYFYSHPLSNETILTYKKKAKQSFGIVLDLIEANALGQIIPKYDGLRAFLFHVSDIGSISSDGDFFDDPKIKAFYDLMSFGSSTDIKYNIIKSYALNYLYVNGITKSNLLLTELNTHFGARIDATYFASFLGKLSSERKVKIHTTKLIELTPMEKNRLKEVLERYHLEESLLRKELNDVLAAYGMKSCVDDTLAKLSVLHESNYSINLGEFIKRKSNINDLHTATSGFKQYLKSKISDQSKLDELCKKLLKIADDNKILALISAGQIYSKVNDPDRLEEYIQRHNNNKDIFLDTNVIINALCVHYESDTDYDNFYYNVAKQFLNYVRTNSLNLKTIRSYSNEIVNIFKEALAIIPFTRLEIFASLGGSKNILYNFFIHLKDSALLHENTVTFSDFLKEFHFETKKSDPDFQYRSQIDFLLNSLGIQIENPPTYNLTTAKTLILEDLIDHERNKSQSAIANDAIMFMRLGDERVEINPIDPIFCTWDISLIRVRKRFFEEFTNCTKWLMYTPSRLMDHYSMMNFQVRQGTLSNEVLTIMDESFPFQEKTQSLLDSMLFIINPEDEVGLKYANKLAEIRQKEIIQLDHKPEVTTDEPIEPHAVDSVFQQLFFKYAVKGDENSFSSFKSIFTRKELFNEVFTVLKEMITEVTDYKNISLELFNRFDDLINSAKELEKTI